MKHLNLIRLWVALSFLLVSSIIAAQEKKYGVALQESFEKGIPENWSQVCIVGNQNWILEENGKYPDGAADGIKRIAIRNNSGSTLRHVTRIITPEMNLDTLLNPILTFAYASEKWTSDFDTLKIFYQTSAEAEWVEYTNHVYDKYRSEWTRDTIILNVPTSTYRIAFQWSDNVGRGIVLDDICVRSKPICYAPTYVGASKISNDTVELLWNANFDTEKSYLKVSSVELDAKELNTVGLKADILDTVLSLSERSIVIRGLSPSTTYYAYVKSLCYGEESEWTPVSSFTTSNVMQVPFVEKFNYTYTAGTKYQMPNWRFYTNSTKTVPFVNTDTEGQKLFDYSNDGTRSLIFADGEAGVALPIGVKTYAITPELQSGVAVNELQLSLWAAHPFNKYVNKFDDSYLLVGVFEDPGDYSTFYAVDTIVLKGIDRNGEYYVDFSNYTGNGRYIAFVSDFNSENHIGIDNLRIEKKTSLSKPYNLSVSYKSADEMTLRWMPMADECDLIISSEEIKDFNRIDEKQIIKRETVAISNGVCVVKNINPWTCGYLYVRNRDKSGEGEWSTPLYIRTPMKFTDEIMKMDFGIDASNSYVPYSESVSNKINNGLIVHYNSIYTSYSTSLSGESSLLMTSRKKR